MVRLNSSTKFEYWAENQQQAPSAEEVVIAFQDLHQDNQEMTLDELTNLMSWEGSAQAFH